MRISGITLGYRALANGYPVVECTRCLLSFCDEVVANIGATDDGTKEALLGLGSGKLRLLEEPWDLGLREKGLALSRETNRAMEQCSGDWIVYLQADEILHEGDIPELKSLMEKLGGSSPYDGIAFRYLHFYGSPWFFQDNPFRWHLWAVRAVRNHRGIVSVGDALKFRRMAGGRAVRLRDVRTGIRIFHYGWARPPAVMVEKQIDTGRFWHDDNTLRAMSAELAPERIYPDTFNLLPFKGQHPAVMQDYVGRTEWNFAPRRAVFLPRLLRMALLVVYRPVDSVRKKLMRWLRKW